MTRGGMDQPSLQTQEDVQMEAVDNDADAAYCGGGWPKRLRDEVADLEARVLPDYMTVFQEGIDHLKRGNELMERLRHLHSWGCQHRGIGRASARSARSATRRKATEGGYFFKIKTQVKLSSSWLDPGIENQETCPSGWLWTRLFHDKMEIEDAREHAFIPKRSRCNSETCSCQRFGMFCLIQSKWIH